MRQPIQIAIYPFRLLNGDREYMLFHRTPQAGDFWQGVTGGVEDDETPLEAANRELLEESGIVGLELIAFGEIRKFPIPESMKHYFSSETTALAEYSYYVMLESECVPVLDDKEHDQWRWVSLSDAIELLFWEGNKESLRECDALLSSIGFG